MSGQDTPPSSNQHFLQMEAADQFDLYQVAAGDLKRDIVALEKDVWVCWTLDALFRCSGLPTMAFKGGTSLSKVYRAIDRFSEDIDITMDCRELGSGDPLEEAPAQSGNARRKVNDELIAQVSKFSRSVAIPHLEEEAERQGIELSFIAENDGAEIHVRYETVLEARHSSYLLDVVKIEFGGRNLTEPCETHLIEPYMVDAPGLDAVEFPSAQVDVLAAERTFWEKFTLAHDAVQRSQVKPTVSRMARHWYDLAKLHRHDVGARSFEDLATFEDVIRVKERFFRSGSSNYHLCLEGRATVVPGGDMLENLRKDYEAMVEAQMLEENPPTFDEVVETVTDLEFRANSLIAEAGLRSLHELIDLRSPALRAQQSSATG